MLNWRGVESDLTVSVVDALFAAPWEPTYEVLFKVLFNFRIEDKIFYNSIFNYLQGKGFNIVANSLISVTHLPGNR